MRIQTIIFSAIILCLARQCICARVFLIGGAANPNNSEIFNALAKSINWRSPDPNKCHDNWSITTCPRIAVVTSAAASQVDGNQAYNIDEPNSPSYYTIFRSHGMAPLHISAHIDNYLTATDQSTSEGRRNYETLMQADIVFFNGGDQTRHSRTWLLDDGSCNSIMCSLISRYRISQVVWSGTSAGTAIMSSPTFGDGIPYGHIYFTNKVGLAPKKVSDGAVGGTGLSDTRNGTSGLQYTDNGGYLSGFPAVSSAHQSDSHFDARGRLVRLIPDMKKLNKTYGIGVDEDTAFFIDGNTCKIYGTNGVFFVDTSNATFPATEYFTVRNVRITYMSSGDQFDLSTRTLTSSKPQIKRPFYNNYTDSLDIAASYECTKLLTRLIDQKAQTNSGRTRIPSGYPVNAPKFEFAFTKDSDTKGYYQNHKYSVDRAIIHVNVVVNTSNLLIDN